MAELKCSLCGAELLPATSFCRQCGAAITDATGERSEATTALLGNMPDHATTQRLDPRPTSPEPSLRPLAGKITTGAPARGRRTVVVGSLALVLIIVGILTTVVLIRMRNTNATADAVALSYPGAQTVVDMTNSL